MPNKTRKTTAITSDKTKATKTRESEKHIGLVKNDPYLEPYENAIRGRHDHALWKLGQLTKNGQRTLSEFASGYDYYGLHKTPRGWVFREWALTPPTYTLSATSTDGRNRRHTDASALRRPATGN